MIKHLPNKKALMTNQKVCCVLSFSAGASLWQTLVNDIKSFVVSTLYVNFYNDSRFIGLGGKLNNKIA